VSLDSSAPLPRCSHLSGTCISRTVTAVRAMFSGLLLSLGHWGMFRGRRRQSGTERASSLLDQAPPVPTPLPSRAKMQFSNTLGFYPPSARTREMGLEEEHTALVQGPGSFPSQATGSFPSCLGCFLKNMGTHSDTCSIKPPFTSTLTAGSLLSSMIGAHLQFTVRPSI
jgi:hypothetical protein